MTSARKGLTSQRQTIRQVLGRMMSERLDPGRSAAAVMVGVSIGIIPIYGFQLLAAAALATLFGLNRPLTLAATFVNNPLLQPFLVIGSLELGSLVLSGKFAPIVPPDLTIQGLTGLIVPLLVGSVILSVLVGGTAAAVTYMVMVRRESASQSARRRERQFRKWAKARFREAPATDRGFVRWKLRLDRLFAILLDADLGQGPVVDLGCGHGVSLGLVAFRDPQRRLEGCDLDAPRIAAARNALSDFDVSLSVADVRDFVLPDAGLILILDVLQYLDVAEQTTLLRRCAHALVPGGRLIFRVPDPARGVFSWTTYGLDRVVWWKTGAKSAPRYGDPTTYRQVLVEAGMRVEMRSYRNRLPFRHLVVFASKGLDTT